jgi:hypothetical protein
MPDETPSEAAASQPVSNLCLSGGGYRAMLFHVSGLSRLNGSPRYEIGVLRMHDRVENVFEVSIASAALARAGRDSTSGPTAQLNEREPTNPDQLGYEIADTAIRRRVVPTLTIRAVCRSHEVSLSCR